MSTIQHYSKDPEREEYFDMVGLVEPDPADEWKQTIENKFGSENVSYREVGANGWDNLNVVDGKPTYAHRSGPHWIDAVPCGTNPLCGLGRLLGTYYYGVGGKFFFKVEG